MPNHNKSKSSGGCKDKDCNDCEGGFLSDFLTWLFKQVKYFFYVLVLYLYPSIFFRFFFRHGDYPWTDPWVAVYMLVAAFFAAMANWAHIKAGPANDPGFLKWEDFRSEEDQRLNRADKSKWDDVIKSGKKIEVQETGAAWDPEQQNTESTQCKKCGVQKIDGVHHCSSCNRCVWKMDHHCPWTDNCVGYLTLKPFILFLTYVTSLSIVLVTVGYRQAWKRGMYHISIINLMPSATHFKHVLLMYFLTDSQRKEYTDEAEKIFQDSVKFDETHPEIFSFASLKHMFNTISASKFSMFNSITSFMDAVIILLTIVCGCYTLFLACQTIWFQKHQSSLVDSMKVEHWQKRPSMYRREIAKFNHQQKTRKPLTWTETLDAVMGEETLLTWKIFVPVYSNPEKRNLDFVSQAYLNDLNSESADATDKKTD